MSGSDAGRRPTVCLCMIVRDEADVLARCLRSALPLIDTWVICDTGSTDGTQDLVLRELADLPGQLHERPWVDFGHNRSELMELARGKADYLLVLDADSTIEAEPGALDGLTHDAYLVRHADGVEYHTKRLVSGRLPWRYVGSVHEHIECEEERTTGRLDGVVIRAWSVGGSRHGRWERDADQLEAAVARDPADARAVFYLAQTYRDLGRDRGDRTLLERALETYERRATMDGWDEEAYNALHQAGLLHAELGDWPAAADAYTRAWELRPQRLEALHDLAAGLNERRMFHAAQRLTALAESPLPVPDDLLFVAPWVYHWGLLFQHAIATYWCGDHTASIAAGKRLLARDDLPAAHREQTERNLAYAIRERARAAVEQRAATPRRVWSPAGDPTHGKT